MAKTKHLTTNKMNKITLSFSFFLFHLSTFFFIASSSTISLGSSISASSQSQSWPSDNSTFSLSFIASPSSPNSFIPAITYAGGVPIWTPGDGRAIVDSAGSLRLLPNGALHLTNGSGSVVWDSRTANLGIFSASLEVTGELRLLGNGSSVVWSSFDSPTDTIVPGHNFTSDQVLNSGFYSFSLQRSGNLTLSWNNSIVYWNKGLNSSFDANLTSPSLGLQPIGILNLFDPSLSNGVIMAYSSDYAEGSDILRFLRLDDDGNLRIYSSSRGSGTITTRWSAVSDQCEVFGYCGNMGICSYNDSNPICGCPSENFETVDVNDRRQGCRRREIEDCPGSAAMLDENYNAKVSDFGLAKLVNPKDHRYRTLTSVRGTRGYLAPEWLANLPITSKSDVYSYGMVLLEIVSGRRNFDVSVDTNRKKFSLWAYEEFEKGNVEGIVDKKLVSQDVDMEQIARAIQVSFWCIQEQPSQRPMMGKVVQMLEGITDMERPPAPKAASEGSISGTSINVSSNTSAFSTFAVSAPAPSSSSSLQTVGVSPLASGRNIEKQSSSLQSAMK